MWIYTISFLIKADIGRPLNSLFFLSLSPVMETLYETLSQKRESLVQQVVPARLISGLAEIADFC